MDPSLFFLSLIWSRKVKYFLSCYLRTIQTILLLPSAWTGKLAGQRKKDNTHKKKKLSLQLQEGLCVAHKRRVDRVGNLQTRRQKQFSKQGQGNSFQSNITNPLEFVWREKDQMSFESLPVYKCKARSYWGNYCPILISNRKPVRNLCNVPQSTYPQVCMEISTAKLAPSWSFQSRIIYRTWGVLILRI